MTGIRPILSASLPLKGLDSPADRVNRAIIHPLKDSPPMELRYAGSSGMIMLKLEKNRKLLKQSRKKSSVKKEGSSLMESNNEKAEDDFLGLVT
jgi:hypothetical protein